MKILKFVGNRKELKKQGYIFRKVYARNYQTYSKKIHNFDICIWIKGMVVEVNDWYQYTFNVKQYYKDNIDSHDVQFNIMSLYIDHETGEIKTREEYDAEDTDFSIRRISFDVHKFKDMLKEIELISEVKEI